MSAFPIEIVNKILIFRPRHPTACIIHDMVERMNKIYDNSVPIEDILRCLYIPLLNCWTMEDDDDFTEEPEYLEEFLCFYEDQD